MTAAVLGALLVLPLVAIRPLRRAILRSLRTQASEAAENIIRWAVFLVAAVAALIVLGAVVGN